MLESVNHPPEVQAACIIASAHLVAAEAPIVNATMKPSQQVAAGAIVLLEEDFKQCRDKYQKVTQSVLPT